MIDDVVAKCPEVALPSCALKSSVEPTYTHRVKSPANVVIGAAVVVVVVVLVVVATAIGSVSLVPLVPKYKA